MGKIRWLDRKKMAGPGSKPLFPEVRDNEFGETERE